MRTKYWLLIIPIILFASCGGRSETSPTSLTQEEFRKLHGFKPMGVYAGFNANVGLFYIGNELVERLIKLDKDSAGISTIGYTNRNSGLNYITAPGDEFQFQIGDVGFSGKDGQLKYLSHEIISLPGGVKQLKIVLQHKDGEGRVLLKVNVNYEIYPNNAVIKKWLEFENLSDSAIIVENLQIERLNWIGNTQEGWRGLKLYGYSLAQNYPIPFSGGADEPIILGFFDERGEGFILGNEAPGVLKHFDLYTVGNTISIGLPPREDNWATEIRVPIGETSASPKTFIMLFTGHDLQKALKDGLGRFVNRYFNVSAKLRELSEYVYLMDLSSEGKAPREKPGKEVKLVCINYDWQQSLLEMTDKDDASEEEKIKPKSSIAEDNFPMLLEFSRSLHDADMKFGIYVNLTAVKMESPISRHFEWAFKRADGKDWTVDLNDEKAKIFCLGSDYGAYANQVLTDLIESLDETVGYHGPRPSVVLDYIILDMPTIGSAEQKIYGCSAYGHGHYSRPESLWKIYESLFAMADFLHQKFPDLVISISPKTYGTQIPDFALLSHIDQFLVFSGENHPKVNDLTNFLPRDVLLNVWAEP
ncbi:MAG: hypothetical protein ACE5PV_13595 [Candidatus Poribacteria bacterium]